MAGSVSQAHPFFFSLPAKCVFFELPFGRRKCVLCSALYANEFINKPSNYKKKNFEPWPWEMTLQSNRSQETTTAKCFVENQWQCCWRSCTNSHRRREISSGAMPHYLKNKRHKTNVLLKSLSLSLSFSVTHSLLLCALPHRSIFKEPARIRYLMYARRVHINSQFNCISIQRF